MAWVDIVAVPAPGTSGHPLFERYYRVQMNTVETLIAFLPGLWLAAKYWQPGYVAAIGAVYLVGRVAYLRAYVREPMKRGPGYALSMGPTMLLLLMALAGAIRALLSG